MLEAGEVVTEIQLPARPPGTFQRYLKFRARLALDAVAPVPFRARDAETFLSGKRIDEETAEAAAANAVRGSAPLPGNRHKVQILRTLVKRAILAAR